MQDALEQGCRDPWMQIYRWKHALLLDAWIFGCRMHCCMDAEIQVETCLVTLMHGFVDAGCIVCRDAEILGNRDTGGSMSCYWMHGFLDAGCIGART